jgi:hypothetical protein
MQSCICILENSKRKRKNPSSAIIYGIRVLINHGSLTFCLLADSCNRRRTSSTFSRIGLHTPSCPFSPQWKEWNVSTSNPSSHFCLTNVAFKGAYQIHHFERQVSSNTAQPRKRQTWSTKRIFSPGGSTKCNVVGTAISKKQFVSKNMAKIPMKASRCRFGM